MKLGIKERLTLISLLPKKGNLETQIRARKLKKDLELTSEEVDRFELITNKQGNLQWNAEKEETVFTTPTDGEIKLLKDIVRELDENKEVTLDNLELCEIINGL